jgi:outer membrane protein assembly factor BamB
MLDQCAGIGLSEDKKTLIVRRNTGEVQKVTPEGKVLWSQNAGVDAVPTAPTEKNGQVFVASKLGLISALTASDGTPLWQYQATPQLWVLSSITAKDGMIYVSGMDGSLTAINAN